MVIQILDHINDDIKQIRTDVFIEEQGFEVEFDDIDDIAKFVLLSIDGKGIGTCRFFPGEEEGDAHIGRMAVRKEYRGQHLGAKIMIAAEAAIRKEGYKSCSLSAQAQARPFYETLGYAAEGEEYLDEGCPHIFMIKVF
ncbi:GNAT family N-acetyltransferase [Veillonella agrestimuris]|uniref:GNAT family N-acetyltransferase n=1 Tax=Veillonella agrestimuris TaxID=2941340 RepID=UPI00203FDE29|nr:GNAT family N-acetyltransferase [Veillonella agrestimuris]